MRGLLNSKSETCTESMEVDAAGINAKASAHYPGISVSLSLIRTTDVERHREGLAEVSRGHSRHIDRAEGPNVKERQSVLNFDGEGDAG